MDRSRGWLYLIVGARLYLTIILIIFFSPVLNLLFDINPILGTAAFTGIYLIIIVIMQISPKLPVWIFQTSIGRKPNPIENYLLQLTVVSALLLMVPLPILSLMFVLSPNLWQLMRTLGGLNFLIHIVLQLYFPLLFPFFLCAIIAEFRVNLGAEMKFRLYSKENRPRNIHDWSRFLKWLKLMKTT